MLQALGDKVLSRGAGPIPFKPQTISPENTLISIKVAQKPSIIGSLGPKASKYESFEGKGYGVASMLSARARGVNAYFSLLCVGIRVCDTCNVTPQDTE